MDATPRTARVNAIDHIYVRFEDELYVPLVGHPFYRVIDKLSDELLSEDEIGTIEDSIADCIEMLPTAMCTDSTVDKVSKMLNLSSKIKTGAIFARQRWGKFT